MRFVINLFNGLSWSLIFEFMQKFWMTVDEDFWMTADEVVLEPCSDFAVVRLGYIDQLLLVVQAVLVDQPESHWNDPCQMEASAARAAWVPSILFLGFLDGTDNWV